MFIYLRPCKNIICIAETAEYFKLLRLSLFKLLSEHIIDILLFKRKQCLFHSFSAAGTFILNLKLIKNIKRNIRKCNISDFFI